MQQKQRPTAKNAKLTFGVRRTELNTVPLHPGTDTPELGARVDCESSILDAARTKQAHSQPLIYPHSTPPLPHSTLTAVEVKWLRGISLRWTPGTLTCWAGCQIVQLCWVGLGLTLHGGGFVSGWGVVGYDVRIPEVREQLLSAHAAQWFGVVEKVEMLATDLSLTFIT